jgi:hypothetical protein
MKIFLSLVVLVVVVGGAVYFWKQSKTDSKPASTNSTQNNSSGNNSKPTTPNPTPSGTDIGSEVMNGGIEGKLYESDNKSRGNLMLVTADKTIYIQTARDYKALFGQDVVMTIDGDLTSFTLVDIKAK